MTLYAILMWIALLICLPMLLLMKKKLATQRQNKQLHPPPSPPKLSIIGNLHQLGELRHQSHCRLFKNYGLVMLIKLGGIPNIVISSVENAREVVKVHDLNCCSRLSLDTTRRLAYNYQDISFAPYGQYWREMRKTCVLEVLSVKMMQSHRSIREEEKLFALTANMTFIIVFGMSLCGSYLDNERFQEVVHEATTMLGSFNASEYVPYVGWIVDRLYVIDLHLKPDRTKPEHEDIIDVLLKIEREQIEADVNLFIGGVDTSAITMIWAMAELVRNPKVMKRAQDEVRKIVRNKGRVPEIDTDHLPYIKMILTETFRLHPPIPLLPRQPIVPFKLNGYDINPQSIMHKNPKEFIPERFIDHSVDYKWQNFELLPFGASRRGCLGMYMGTSTIELALVNLLYCFDWKLPPEMKDEDINMEESLDCNLTANKKTPLNLVPAKLF
ncbi:hypothetical protein CIPAW_06G065900 [Carya illinoinensis]|uniref:Cytochrome P450 n=1 Tax=Carya illinoinensis TaxID=32201 RepID=A0A8T1Q8J4_CARIL|nr:hypothetical protein CIPAW_06G065900 [Carya illinoinensis]